MDSSSPIFDQVSSNSNKRSSPSGANSPPPPKYPRTQRMSNGSTEPDPSMEDSQLPQDTNNELTNQEGASGSTEPAPSMADYQLPQATNSQLMAQEMASGTTELGPSQWGYQPHHPIPQEMASGSTGPALWTGPYQANQYTYNQPMAPWMATGSTESAPYQWGYQPHQYPNTVQFDSHGNPVNGTTPNFKPGQAVGWTNFQNSDQVQPTNSDPLPNGPQAGSIMGGMAADMPFALGPYPQIGTSYMPTQATAQSEGFPGLGQGISRPMMPQNCTHQGESAPGQKHGNHQEGHTTPFPATDGISAPPQQPKGLEVELHNFNQPAPADPEIQAPLEHLPGQASPIRSRQQQLPLRPAHQEPTFNPPDAIDQAQAQDQQNNCQQSFAPGPHNTAEEAAPVETTPVESVPSTSGTIEQDEESQRLEHAWSRFVGTHDLGRLFQGHGSMTERQKYARYFEDALNNMREDFDKSVVSGLAQLLATTDKALGPVEGPVVEDLGAIVGRIRASREAATFEGFSPSCTTSRVEKAAVHSRSILEEALPTELDFNKVKYGKSQKVHGEGGRGRVIGEFEIVKGKNHATYAGHRGGDFVFRYAGKQGLERDSFQRFAYAGQVPRTAQEYEWRLGCIKEEVNCIMRAVFEFKFYWDAQTKGCHRDEYDASEGIPVEDTLVLYLGSKKVLPELEDKDSAFRRKMAEWLCSSNVICEFGWLVEKGG